MFGIFYDRLSRKWETQKAEATLSRWPRYQRTENVVEEHGLIRSFDKTRHYYPLSLHRLINHSTNTFLIAKVVSEQLSRLPINGYDSICTIMECKWDFSSFKSRDRKIIVAIDGHMCFRSSFMRYTSVGIAGNLFGSGDARRHHKTRKSSYRSFDRDLWRFLFLEYYIVFLYIIFFILLIYNNSKYLI